MAARDKFTPNALSEAFAAAAAIEDEAFRLETQVVKALWPFGWGRKLKRAATLRQQAADIRAPFAVIGSSEVIDLGRP